MTVVSPFVASVSPNTFAISVCTGARQGVEQGFSSGLGRCASSKANIVNCSVSASSFIPPLSSPPQQITTGRVSDGEIAFAESEIEDGRDSVH